MSTSIIVSRRIASMATGRTTGIYMRLGIVTRQHIQSMTMRLIFRRQARGGVTIKRRPRTIKLIQLRNGSHLIAHHVGTMSLLPSRIESMRLAHLPTNAFAITRTANRLLRYMFFLL